VIEAVHLRGKTVGGEGMGDAQDGGEEAGDVLSDVQLADKVAVDAGGGAGIDGEGMGLPMETEEGIGTRRRGLEEDGEFILEG